MKLSAAACFAEIAILAMKAGSLEYSAKDNNPSS
jgi:hypothetical protein